MPRTERRTRRGPRGVPWLAIVIAAGVLALLGFGFAVVELSAPVMPQPARSAGLAVGVPAPIIALPATTGDALSLDRLRGSKVVVYFYEGAG